MIVGRVVAETFKTIFKLLLVVVVIAIIGTACYYGIKVYKTEHARSATYGNAETVDPYQDFDLFNHDFTKEIAFSSEGTTRSYKTSIPVTTEFDGENQKYNVLINDSPCEITTSTVGIIQGVYRLYFQDTTGEINSTVEIDFKISVFVAKIDFEFTTVADEQDFANLLTYVDVNGFKIRLIDERYRKTAVTSYIPIGVCDITVDDSVLRPTEQGATPAVSVVYNGRTLNKDTNYSLTVVDNDNYGRAYITVSGTGEFTGAVMKSFIVDGEIPISFTQQTVTIISTNDITQTVTFPAVGLKADSPFVVNISQTCRYRFGIWYDQGTHTTARSNGNEIIGTDLGYGSDFRYQFDCFDDNVLTMSYRSTTTSGWETIVTITSIYLNFENYEITGHNTLREWSKPLIADEIFDKTIPDDEFDAAKVVSLDSDVTCYEINVEGLSKDSDFEITATLEIEDLTFNLNSLTNEILVNGVTVKIDFYCFNYEKLFVQFNASRFNVIEGATLTVLNITQ